MMNLLDKFSYILDTAIEQQHHRHVVYYNRQHVVRIDHVQQRKDDTIAFKR